MRAITRATFAIAIGSALLAPAAQAQTKDFSWDGRITGGHWLYVRNLNGAIRVEKATGDRAEVTAVKRWRRGDPDDVRIEMRKIGPREEDVIICAYWPSRRSRCDEDGYNHESSSGWNRNNDVSVEFTVRLPEGVKLVVSTVNGAVRVDGATSEVEASTVNGGVEATSSGGPVRASTVNGDVDVHMRSLGTGDLEYSTVNGSVTVDVPADVDAELDMRTVNGSVSADFPITLTGRINPRHIRATIGKGGRRIKLETVNGSVRLRKA
jgi:putative adhesin